MLHLFKPKLIDKNAGLTPCDFFEIISLNCWTPCDAFNIGPKFDKNYGLAPYAFCHILKTILRVLTFPKVIRENGSYYILKISQGVSPPFFMKFRSKISKITRGFIVLSFLDQNLMKMLDLPLVIFAFWDIVCDVVCLGTIIQIAGLTPM